MCGIVAFLASQRLGPERLLRATRALERRGPDGEGWWLAPGGECGLGHRRLAIVDQEGGAQPFFNEDRSLCAVVNGEFYGAAGLRQQLEAGGHVLVSWSDSELLCHLYEEYGTACVQHLRGEFAFALYDERRRRLVAARDRYGIKPLCYSQQPGELWLASRARALLAAGLPARWDESAFFHACATQYLPSAGSWFAGVRQLPPGCLLVAEEQGLRVERYWDYPLADCGSSGDPEEFLALLEECVRCRLPAGLEPAFQLSGGLDSGAVVAIAARCMNRPPAAFTVSFAEGPPPRRGGGNADFDELPGARELAEHCGARLQAVSLTGAQLREALPEAVLWSEGTAVNLHLSAKFLLSRAIERAGHKVVLTGEGADEVLLGYAHYRQDLGLGSADTLLQTNAASQGIMLTRSPGLSLQAVQERLGHVPAFFRAKAALGKKLLSVMREDFVRSFAGRDCYLEMLGEHADLERRPAVERSACLWNRSALANYILSTLGDGCEMAHSLEGRLPFLDHRLAEWVAGLPLECKVRPGQEKWILREALRPHIPDSLYRREKQPFMAPPLQAARILPELLANCRHRFIDPARLGRVLAELPERSQEEQREWEPALTWLVTSYYLQSGLGLPGG